MAIRPALPSALPDTIKSPLSQKELTPDGNLNLQEEMKTIRNDKYLIRVKRRELIWKFIYIVYFILLTLKKDIRLYKTILTLYC